MKVRVNLRVGLSNSVLRVCVFEGYSNGEFDGGLDRKWKPIVFWNGGECGGIVLGRMQTFLEMGNLMEAYAENGKTVLFWEAETDCERLGEGKCRTVK